jgi:radical SAM superfamily enzyme YgiQ (UPF0313 family)
MEQQRAHDKDRIWAGWMRAANDGDEIAYRRLLEALATAPGARNAQMESQSTITQRADKRRRKRCQPMAVGVVTTARGCGRASATDLPGQ